ncbi:MAG: tyrosine-type recombinase/integrase [Methanosarcinaceae archaeon]|nr:tyrosine-type recombinase/integrase [Methanosarcinaceae archaeon]
MVIHDIDSWIAKNGDDGTGQGKRIYQTFHDHMVISGAKFRTQTTYLSNMQKIVRLCPDMDFFNLSGDDVKRIQIEIVKRFPNHSTAGLVKITLRKWLQSTNQKDLLSGVKVTATKGNGKLPDDMITPAELEKLLASCTHPRDQAIIALLYDSGCRIGELLSMRVRDVEFDDNGAVVTFPEGKTGWRKNRVVYASSYLRQLLEIHEYKDDKDFPLFYSRKSSRPITYAGVLRQLKVIAQKAGIKRRIHPHLFRHTRATELANHLTEQQLKKQFGWTQASNMAARYVHLSDRDVEKAILKASGVDISEDGDNMPKAVKCPRCREFNPPNASYCFKCGLLLSQPLTDENEQYVKELVAALQKNPQILLKYLAAEE